MAGRSRPQVALRVVAALCAALACAHAHALYPDRPVRVVAPVPAGGPGDALGRLLAQKMAESTGQKFVVANRADGNAVLGASEVAKSAADGYTLLFSANDFTIVPVLAKTAPYNVYLDFTPIALVAKGPLALAVNAALPVKNVNDLINYAKLHPGKVAFAIGATGSSGHLATEMLKRAAGLDIPVVPYKGPAPAYQDLAGGQVQAFIDPLSGAQPQSKDARIRVLAVTSSRRLPSELDTPTVAETIRGFELYAWYGLWAPKALPRDVRFTLNMEANKALEALRARLVGEGYELAIGSPEEFARFQLEDMRRAAKIVLDAQIKAE
ncbi:MAG: tripartite tricarboxylate transporter substrate binding protein [Proteobacteria bacterium]|nr:tripartite tricarboxylate transporter substrate binding protein [Pseudomonadota bacterium]